MKHAEIAHGRARCARDAPAGRRIGPPRREALGAGEHTITIPLHTDDGREVSPGLYFVRVTAPGLGITRRLVIRR